DQTILHGTKVDQVNDLSTGAACQKVCTEHTDCDAFVWSAESSTCLMVALPDGEANAAATPKEGLMTGLPCCRPSQSADNEVPKDCPEHLADTSLQTSEVLQQLPDLATAYDCQKACTKRSDCGAFTFGLPPGSTSGEVCFLRRLAPDETPRIQPQDGMTSGLPCGCRATPENAIWPESDIDKFTMPLPRGSEPSKAKSILCLALVVPYSYEVGLIQMQYAQHAGIFECDEYQVYSNQAMVIAPGLETRKVMTSQECEVGGEFKSALNLRIFAAFWRQVISDGHYLLYNWIVKADPDTVFFVDRLRNVLELHEEGSQDLASTDSLLSCSSYMPASGIMAETAENMASLCGVLAACFGKDGNFTVVVEERSSDMLESSKESEASVKRTEFKVWSLLLAQWSPVFEKMVGSDNYAESQQSQVVIQDFSAVAVEIFLRFLYSGSVGGSITALVEVAAIADKYQVEALYPLCLYLVRTALKPELACEVLAVADGFHMAEMRAEALDVIFTNPKEALGERPEIRPELLEEILGSSLLCIAEDDLKEILQSWRTKEENSLESIISINVRTHSEHTDNVLYTFWERYRKAGKKGTFVGGWVVVILGLEQREAYTMDQLQDIASSTKRFTLGKGWVQWQLLHAAVHLRGFSFGDDGDASFSASFRIWSSEDGATWHLAYESLGEEILGDDFLACKRPPSLVNYFKVEVLEGELSGIYFSIHGILQTPI
ncbi:SPOPL, partial [Symbiodinium sp. CCMP2456]